MPEKSGYTITHHGYRRITTGPQRGMLEHRAKLAVLCREFCYYPLCDDGLPKGFTVEHLNHKRQHNCPHCNLILLDARIHRYISWRSWLSKERIGEIAGQSPPEPGPDDHRPEDQKVRTYWTKQELSEVPF